MQHLLATALTFFGLFGLAASQGTNPLAKVISLLDELSAKVTQEGEEEAKAYEEYATWCGDVTKEKEFEIKEASSQKEKLEAKIQELAASIEVSGSKIEDLAAAISASEAELKNATTIRDDEAATFVSGEKELMEVLDTLGRAVTVLEKEMQKSPAAFAQITKSSGLADVLPVLGTVVDAAAFSTADKQRLMALVQSAQTDQEDDGIGAPAADAYESHSGGIVDVLEDMKDKAETQLSDLRKAEADSKHNFMMLKQSLEDQIAADNKELETEKTSKAAAEEGKAHAEGDLEMTIMDLKTVKEALEDTKAECVQVAADHDATVKARAEELKVIAEATKVLEETTAGAGGQAYSFLQVGVGVGAQARVESTRNKLVAMVKHLAKQQHSAALNQLASRIAAVMKLSAASGDDPFAKVKGLIQDLIAKLQEEAGAEATEKAYCDAEMKKTTAKKDELDTDVSKLTSKIDIAVSRSSELKEQVKEFQSELAALNKEQATMDKVRTEEHAAYEKAKAELELGLTGVRRALVVLRDYYAQGDDEAAFVQGGMDEAMQQPAKPKKYSAAGGAASSIIGILEVVESDFASGLAKEETEEASAQEAYEKETQDNKISKAEKSQGVDYKTKEFTKLDKSVAELSSDRDTVSAELDAVLQYDAKLKERCVAKPETYEERKKRREAEIAGLKEAMSILESEAALVQSGKRFRSRHVRAHA